MGSVGLSPALEAGDVGEEWLPVVKVCQTCHFVGNFTSCIFFPSHIGAEVCFRIAFISVMHDRTECTQKVFSAAAA